MIKGVLFDYGGVVAHGGRPGMLSNNLAAKLDIPNSHAEKLLEYGFAKFKRGLIDEDEFWDVLEKAYNKKIPRSRRGIWATWEELVPIPAILQLIQDIKAAGLRTDLLSNTEPRVAQTLREHGAYDHFSKVILSCETGYAKPDTEIYTLALKEIGLAAEECLFIDDQTRMLKPAQQIGMHVIHAQNTEKVIADVRKALLLE